MNTISQILALESTNTHYIRLYREGIFLKAYERSAYAFVIGIQKFMVKKRFIKCVNQEVVSIGFPSEGLYKHFAKEKVKEIENGVQVELEQEIDLAAFEQWKQGIALTIEKPRQASSPAMPIPPITAPVIAGGEAVAPCSLSDQEAMMKVRMYPIEGKTPLECMLFLSELKKSL